MKPKTPEEVKDRFKKAIEIYKHLPSPKPKKLTSSLSSLPYKQTYEKNEIIKAYFALPNEIDEADTVQFYWFPLLSPLERRIIWQHYSGKSIKRIAKDEDLTPRQILYRLKKSIDYILSKQKDLPN